MKRTILIVEDDHALADIFGSKLEDAGYSIVHAGDGEAALEQYAQNKPDLMLMDIMMPKISGFDVADIIRNNDSVTPILFLSALSQAEDLARARKLGADGYLIESAVGTKEVIDTVRAVLEMTPEQRAAKRSAAQYELPVQPREEKPKEREEKADEFYHNMLAAVARSLKGDFAHIGFSLHAIRDSKSVTREVLEECEHIERALEDSQLILERLLKFLDFGTQKSEDIELTAILQKLRELLEPRISSKITLEATVDPPLAHTTIQTNREFLLLVLKELVLNATTAILPKSGTIKILVTKEKDSVVFSVADTGPGIPKELQAALFKKRVASKKGSGIGLFLTEKIVEELGGTISISSTSKQGTTVTLTLRGQRTS